MKSARVFETEKMALTVAVVGIILGQYLTVSLPFRRSLEVRALLVLLFTSIPLIVGLRRRGLLQRVFRMPRPVLLGVGLWAGAAILGTIVGLIRGNEPYLVAGQLFSMALLPCAFIAARSLDLENHPRFFSAVFVGTAVGACLVQFGYWAVRTLIGKPLFRVALPNSLSFVGLSIMALILAFALILRGGGRLKLLGLGAAPIVGIYIIGSGTRSVALAAALGTAVFCVVVGTAWRGLRGLATLTVLVVATGLVVFAVLAAMWHAPRSSAMPMESFLEPFWTVPPAAHLDMFGAADEMQMEVVWKPDGQMESEWISLPYPVDPMGTYRASLEIAGEGTGTAWMDIVSLTPSLEECSHRRFWAEAGTGWRHYETVVLTEFAGAPVVRIRVGCDEGAEGTWRARNVRLESYSMIVPRPLQRNLVFLYDRLMTSWSMVRTGTLYRDPSIRVRLEEMEAARGQVMEAPLPVKVVGHGLGARLMLEEPGFNALGERTVFKDPNYIHNFFAFLALKLGAVGGVAILAALGAWIFQSIEMIRRGGREWGVAPGAASLAVWIAYTAWGVFCPQLIDFGDAPLFGFFLACWVAADHTHLRGYVQYRGAQHV